MSDYIIPIDQFEYLLIAGVPFLDVRAEVEFAKGSFPTSTNIPILRNEERKVVGTCYKEKGRGKAIELAHSLITGATKNQRIEAWCEFIKVNPNAHIYCWRGGMRSNYAREWILEAGVDIPLINGGFKSLRKVIIDQIIDAADCVPIIRIGGKTGTADKVNFEKPGYIEDKVITTFVAAFPMEAPRYVLVVTLDEPEDRSIDKPMRTAGWTAVPVASEIIKRIAPVLGVKPNKIINKKMLSSSLTKVAN